MRSGLTGNWAFMSKAVPPPISASRKRSTGKPAAEGWKVNMMIIAEMAASFTPRSPAQEHRHRQHHEDTGLHHTDTDDGQQQVGHRDPEGHPECHLDRAPAALAHRQPQHDGRRNRGERGPL